MNISELRTGSWVRGYYYSHMGMLRSPSVQIWSINKTIDTVETDYSPNKSFRMHEIEGVPLNPEWLRSNFQLENEHGFYWKWIDENRKIIGHFETFKGENVMAFEIESGSDAVKLKDIRFVHELQNLWQALTGEELN